MSGGRTATRLGRNLLIDHYTGNGFTIKCEEMCGKVSDGNVSSARGVWTAPSVKTTDRGGVHGYDAGKKVNGRKRHVLVDTMGWFGCWR